MSCVTADTTKSVPIEYVDEKTGEVYSLDDWDNFCAGKSSNDSMRFLLQTRNAGAVIGYRGDNVRRLEREFNALVNIPDGESPERILRISPNNETVRNCLRRILEWLEDYTDESSVLEIKPLIHQSQVEFFTSEIVEEMSKSCNCAVKIAKSCCPKSTDRVISLRGTVDQIISSVLYLQTNLKKNSIIGAENYYIPAMYSDVPTEDYLGWGLQAGYGSKGMPRQHRAKLLCHFENDYKQSQRKRLKENIDSCSIMKIAVPCELSTPAFGDDGKRLARLRKESGADVIVGDGEIKEEMLVTISGSNSEIKRARRMLEDHIRLYSE